MIKNFSQFWEIMVNGGNLQNFSYFDINTRWPELHIWRDPHSFFVIRIIFPIIILGAKSFLLTTLLLSWFSFLGIWKLYKLFCTFYPHLYKQFAIAFLFYPSVIFWGSGILKDTITLSAIGWYCYGFYMVFIKRQKIFSNLIAIIISVWFIIAIKPYIFIALIPGTIIWLFFERLKKIANPLLRIIIMPFILGVSISFGIGTIQLFGKNLDTYSSLDKMIAKAEVTQSDLKNAEQYGYNYYDLGEMDFTVKGILKKSPQAIIAGLFRPFIWEVRSAFAVIAGLENFILLSFVIFLIIRLGFFSFFRTFFRSPLLTFSFFFSMSRLFFS